MKRLILPLLLVLTGSAAGIGAGLYLRPTDAHGAEAEPVAEEPETPREYVKFTNQFVVPIVEEGEVASLVVLSLSLEIGEGQSEAVLEMEPKLRDAVLRRLFDHANTGGFDGDFTEIVPMDRLHTQLLETVQKLMPEVVSDVLITDIGRQDG